MPSGVGFSLAHEDRDETSLRYTLIFEAFSVVREKFAKGSPSRLADRHQILE
jgi:hypothetical protein